MKLCTRCTKQPTMVNAIAASAGIKNYTRKDMNMQVCACFTRGMKLNTTNQLSKGLGAGLVMGLAALPAIAGTPAALDHVPANAQAVIVVPNLGSMLNDINAINTMMGDMSQPEIMMVTSMVRGMPGLNLAGSVAGVLSFTENMEDPDMVFLLPVSDFNAFAEGHALNEGLYEFDMGDAMLYFRDAGGGYAVLGEDDELVADYNAAGGNLGTHAAALGKAGGRVADSNDLFVYINFAGFQDEIKAGLAEFESQGEMVEMMGGAEAAQSFDEAYTIIESIANDGASFVMGMNFDQELGLAFDVGMQFKGDSKSASYLNNDGDAGKYFANVPSMDYFYATAFDMSGEGIQKIMSGYMDMIQKFDTTGMMGQMGMVKLMTEVNGGIQVMGASDNIMGGLFENMLYYMDVDDNETYVKDLAAMYKGMNEQMGQLKEMGINAEMSMDTEPTVINGVEAFGYSMSMDMSQMDAGDAMGGMNPAMIMSMIFGGENGPSGYVAKAGEGIVMTFSKDAQFLSKAAKAAAGENTMKGNASIAKTAAMLPNNRIMETYIGADHLVNTAGPMLMMFGLIPEFAPLDALAPIGMGLTADGGGVMLRTVFPMQTVGTIMEMVPADMMNNMGGYDDDEEMEDENQDENMDY